jgi:prephenate dehydratase
MTKTNNIAFQGVLGAYSHMACQAHCPDLTPLPCASFSEMIAMVQDGGADCAMVPVENSTAGRVADIHHLLPESGLFIIAEHYQPVAHKLLGIKGAQLSDITEVHSHEQGLAQCRLTLQKMGIKPVIHSDTAGAAKDIAARGERHVGAIASALAGDIYGLDTVQDTITDKVTNTTRFLIMSRERVVPQDTTAPAMTTIIFEVRSVPAVLYKALGGFATNGINLTKLESYMLDGSMNAARFYVDCEGHPETDSMKLALEELQFYCTDGGIRILGTYLTNR